MRLEGLNPPESSGPKGGLPGNGDSKPQRNCNGEPSATVSQEAVKGPWFDVPAGTLESRCRSCRRVVFWIVTDAGKRMPVDCDVAGGMPPAAADRGALPSSLAAGRGVSHFATCPQAGTWRRL